MQTAHRPRPDPTKLQSTDMIHSTKQVKHANPQGHTPKLSKVNDEIDKVIAYYYINLPTHWKFESNCECWITKCVFTIKDRVTVGPRNPYAAKDGKGARHHLHHFDPNNMGDDELDRPQQRTKKQRSHPQRQWHFGQYICARIVTSSALASTSAPASRNG